MPEKLGNGGHGREEYDPNTGKYVADGRPNKVYNNPGEPSYGYHAGDLGRAESYWSQSGNRGTGHLGTGTYFVGNPDVLTKNYKERPQHKIDFNNYNLYKPSSNDFGYKLHDTLKLLNEDFGFYSSYLDLKDDVDFLLNAEHDNEWADFDWLYKDGNAEKVINSYNKLVENGFIDGEIVSYEKEPDFDDDDWIDWMLTHDDESIEDKASEVYRKFYKEMFSGWNSRGSSIEVMEKITDRLYDALEGRHSLDEIENALKKVTDTYSVYENQGGRNHKESNTWDSLSTVFMKALGYEGVDVRHLGDNGDTYGLDNTKYGSVIYDLKGEDLETHKRAKADRQKASQLYGINIAK